MSSDAEVLERLFQDEVARQMTILHGYFATLREPDAPLPGRSFSQAYQAIKGAARVVGFADVAQLAADLERFFAATEGTGRALSEAAYRATERANAILELAAEGARAVVETRVRAASDDIAAIRATLAAEGSAAEKQGRPVPAAREARRSEHPGLDASMEQLFKLEAEAHTAALADGLMLLEREPQRLDVLDKLMREAHSLKGAARVVGLDACVNLTHALEDLFVRARSGAQAFDTDRVELCLQATDLILRVARRGDDRPRDADLAELTARLAAGTAPAAAITPTDSPRGVVHVPAPAPTPTPVPTPAPALEAALTASAGRVIGAPAEGRADDADRVLRVRASHLSRVVGLSGELLVETRRLGPLGDTQQRLRARHASLADLLNDLHQALGAPPPDDPVGEQIAELRTRIAECRDLVGTWVADFAGHARRSEDLTLRLFREASAGRMRPIADGLAAFPRMVRDLARRLNKRVDLEILGEDTVIDRDILEKIEAPLNHIVRNCVDHGIEAPEDRAALGKPARGVVRIAVAMHSTVIQIRISDDGRGLDPGSIRRRVSALGLLPAEKAEALDDERAFDYIFSPGFSTTDVVTEVSGRGVGLDVVQSVLHEVGGSVHVVSERGRGASFELRVPVSRSVIRAVVVLIADEPYAFPLNQIDRLLMVSLEELQLVEDRQYIVVDNRSVAMVPAAQILELDGAVPTTGQISAVMLSDRTHRFAFAVDRFVGEFDLVVRPLDPRLGRVTDVSAAAILPDGTPVLILDTEDLVRSVLRLQQVTRFTKLESGGTQARKTKRVLVVDDSITVRELQRQLLASHGYEVVAAVDGVDGFRAVRDEAFDLVVTDIDMPRMDGLALTRSIKQDARLRTIPVVLMSYRDSPADRKRGLDAAADYFLGKSEFSEDALLRVVMDLIGPA